MELYKIWIWRDGSWVELEDSALVHGIHVGVVVTLESCGEMVRAAQYAVDSVR